MVETPPNVFDVFWDLNLLANTICRNIIDILNKKLSFKLYLHPCVLYIVFRTVSWRCRIRNILSWSLRPCVFCDLLWCLKSAPTLKGRPQAWKCNFKPTWQWTLMPSCLFTLRSSTHPTRHQSGGAYRPVVSASETQQSPRPLRSF